MTWRLRWWLKKAISNELGETELTTWIGMKLMSSYEYKTPSHTTPLLRTGYNFFHIILVLILKFWLNHFLIWWCNYIFNGKLNWVEIVPCIKKRTACHFDWGIKSHFPPHVFPPFFHVHSTCLHRLISSWRRCLFSHNPLSTMAAFEVAGWNECMHLPCLTD